MTSDKVIYLASLESLSDEHIHEAARALVEHIRQLEPPDVPEEVEGSDLAESDGDTP